MSEQKQACECPKQKALEEIAALLDALDTCHVCRGSLHLEDVEPTHCEDCSGDCDSHDEPSCEPLSSLHRKARRAVAALSAPCSCAELREENRRLRLKLFGTFNADKEVHGCSHSTACSIWGDDGQGGTVEGFAQPLPCNCGALKNWEKNQKIEALNSLQAERDSLRAAHEAIISNLADALFPNSPPESARAEFVLDAAGACSVIRSLRARVEVLEAALRRIAAMTGGDTHWAWMEAYQALNPDTLMRETATPQPQETGTPKT